MTIFAQHSVHPTGGSLRVFKQFAWLEVCSVKATLSCPAHQRVTQAVGRLIFDSLKQGKINSMGNADFTTHPNKSTQATIDNSEITRNEKLILGVLLFILGLILIALGQKILQNKLRLPLVHDRIIVGGYRYGLIFGYDSIQYVFSIEQSKKIDVKLPDDLGNYAEWSPDGQWIVFSKQDRSQSNIYIMRADGSQQTLVPTPHGGEDPTWSPDGKQIAFYSCECDVKNPIGAGIYVTNVECLLQGESCTPKPRLLVEDPRGRQISSPDWSPDGRKIAYTGVKHITVINVDGQGQAVKLPPYFSGRTADPQWSPDGTKIVGMCYGEISGVCVMNRDGSNLVYLVQDATRKNAYGPSYHPSWSPDGQKIAYISTFSDRPMARSIICINPDGCGTNKYPQSVFIMNADGSQITHLPLEANVEIRWFDWYP